MPCRPSFGNQYQRLAENGPFSGGRRVSRTRKDGKNMKIGIPSEVKNNETRVGMTPAGVSGLSGEGHPVVVQKGAGNGCGFPDREYRDAGARILDKAEDVYAEADRKSVV